MKNRYRLFRRRGRIYYCFDNQTQRYTSLNTADRDAARQIVEAKNRALVQPALSREIGKAYLAASDPAIRNRTWQDWSTTIISGHRRQLKVSSGLGVGSSLLHGFSQAQWFWATPVGGTESVAPSGAADAVEPTGVAGATAWLASRSWVLGARTLPLVNSRIVA